MKLNKINRSEHVGKSKREKEAYRNFIASMQCLDKTEDDPIDTAKTYESSFEEESRPSEHIKKKSTWLKVKDFLYDNWVVTIIGGFIVGLIFLVISSYSSTNRELGIYGEKIVNIDKGMNEIKKNQEDDRSTTNSLRESFVIFKTEVFKDIEFIKKKIR